MSLEMLWFWYIFLATWSASGAIDRSLKHQALHYWTLDAVLDRCWNDFGSISVAFWVHKSRRPVIQQNSRAQNIPYLSGKEVWDRKAHPEKTIYVFVLHLVYHWSLFCKLDSGILYICCGILSPCAPSFDGVLAYNLCKSRSATGKHNTHPPDCDCPNDHKLMLENRSAFRFRDLFSTEVSYFFFWRGAQNIIFGSISFMEAPSPPRHPISQATYLSGKNSKLLKTWWWALW